MIKQNRLKIGLILTSTLLIASCGGDSDKPKGSDDSQRLSFNDAAVIQMSNGKSSQVGITPRSNLKQITNRYYPSDKTDFINIGYNDNFYHIGRYKINLIQKYNIQSVNKGSYAGDGFSPNDAGETADANVHSIAFVNGTKAYMTRYGSTKAWIINPSVQNASQFKTGELNLSDYLDTSNGNKAKVPHMDHAVIANNKLFLSLQRLGDNASPYTPSRAAYIAVFDTNTDKEVDTKKGKDALKGIELKIKNPQAMALSGDNLYVSGPTYDKKNWKTGEIIKKYYEGGIEKINTKTYASEVIYSSKETDPIPNNGLVVGKVSGVAVINGTDVYTRIYKGGTNDQLAKVKNQELEVVDSFKDKYVTTIKTGPDGDLWVGTGLKGEEQPKLYRLSKTDLSIKDSVQLPSNPIGITFIKQ